MRLIEAFAHETVPLKPIAPLLSVPAARNIVVGGVALPANTLVVRLMRKRKTG